MTDGPNSERLSSSKRAMGSGDDGCPADLPDDRRGYAACNACPTGAFGVLSCPCIQRGPEAATKAVAKAGVSRCWMSRSWRLGAQVAEEIVKECECRRRRVVPTSGRRSFRRLSSRRATRRRMGVCHIHRRYSPAARIGAGDNGIFCDVVGRNKGPPFRMG